jgi:surface-anchored protein
MTRRAIILLTLPLALLLSGLARAAGGEFLPFTEGHMDIGPRVVDGQLAGYWNNDGAEVDGRISSVPEYPANGIRALAIFDAATPPFSRQAGSSWDFVGVNAGEPIYILPASGKPNTIPYLGWGTESPSLIGRGFDRVRITLIAMTAPTHGVFALFTGTTNVPMKTIDGITAADSITVDLSDHLHYNWSFSQLGTYELTFRFEGLNASNQVVMTGEDTFRFEITDGNTPTPAPAIALTGDLAFGNLTVGQSATRTLTISNPGNATLTVNSLSYPTGFSGNWSSGTIAAGASQDVTVTFAPNAVQTFSGNVTINSNATSGTNTIAASGTGTAIATRIIGLSGDLAFGTLTVGQTSTRSLLIGNTGNAPLQVSSIAYPPGFSGNWPGGTINAGSSRSVTVTFTPTAVQSYGGSIQIVSDATSGPDTTTTSGAASPPWLLLAAPGTPVFNGTVTSVTQTFHSTPATTLQIQFTSDLKTPWTTRPATVNSGTGTFDVTFTQAGDHTEAWSRHLFFRLAYDAPTP